MAIKTGGRKRSLSKKVSAFNMYDDQVYQIHAIMESTGEHKDAPVIRELLDEALGARRRKALGYADDEPPGQGTAETLNTIHVLLLKLVKHSDGKPAVPEQKPASFWNSSRRRWPPSLGSKSADWCGRTATGAAYLTSCLVG